MKKQSQQELIGMAMEELDVWMGKMQKIKESVQNRPNGVSAKDFIKRVRKTLDNCDKKMETIENMASKK